MARQTKKTLTSTLSRQQEHQLEDVFRQMLQQGQLQATPENFPSLMASMSKCFVQAALKGEMQHHLQNPPEGTDTAAKPNKRNGVGRKTLQLDDGEIEIDIPRDRNGTFDPLLVPKYARRIKGFDERVIAMYARGMSVREISAFIEEQYGFGLSAETISTITDTVLDDVHAWQNRPLDAVYPVVFFDALRVKIRSSTIVKAMAVHIGLGIRVDGTREVLGLWIHENEGASNWASVFSELQNRGVEDIIIAVTDGLKGMTQALASVFPATVHQTCIVHLIRNSLAFVNYKDRKPVTDALKKIYTALNASEAEKALAEYEASELGKRYPSSHRGWRQAWGQVIPFFDFPAKVRRLLYTTNSIEALNRSIRKVIKTRTVFPNEEAAMKLIWLALQNATKTWTHAVRAWAEAVGVMGAMYGERLERGLR